MNQSLFDHIGDSNAVNEAGCEACIDDAEDPFGEDAPIPPAKRPGGIQPTAKPGSDEWRTQLADYAQSGHTDMDSYAASKAATAGKGRKKRPNFLPYARAYYADRGLVFERKETQIWIKGCDFPMSMDYLGIFDGLVALPDGSMLGVQVCAKEGITPHVRKMLSEKRCMAGNRRKNLLKWWQDGNRAVILSFAQPGGKGSKWLPTEREVTVKDLERVIAGKSVSASGEY